MKPALPAKPAPHFKSRPLGPKEPTSGKSSANPAPPHPVDPRGPEQCTWPPGVFNFGNVVLFGCFAVFVLLLILSAVARQ